MGLSALGMTLEEESEQVTSMRLTYPHVRRWSKAGFRKAGAVTLAEIMTDILKAARLRWQTLHHAESALLMPVHSSIDRTSTWHLPTSRSSRCNQQKP